MNHRQETRLKMFWFARWLAMNYEGYLNKETGQWYAEQLRYFEETAYPNMLETARKNEGYDLTETMKILNGQR